MSTSQPPGTRPDTAEMEAADRHEGGPQPTPDAPPPQLLVVSYLFHPDGSVGGLRWTGITKYLARSGWRIDALTGSQVERPAELNGVRIQAVRRASTLNDAYRRFFARPQAGGSGTAPAATSAGTEPASGARLARLRRTLAVALRYPDYSRGWVHRAAFAARRIISREKVDVVVSSGPPHTAHLAALFATIGTRARWIIDLRDPWIEWYLVSEAPGILKALMRFLERWALTRCDRVVCNTRQYASALEERRLAPVTWIPNGIDLEDLGSFAQADPRPGTLTLAYVGTLYFNRNLGPIIRAMEVFLGRSGPDGPALKLRFAGHADPEHSAALERQLQTSGLDEKHVERLGHVPQEEARRIVCEADLCLVLAQGQPVQVPAKLYEAVGTGVQTLVLAESGTSAATEAERLGVRWVDPSDLDGIVGVLEGLADGSIPKRLEARGMLDYGSIAEEYSELLRAVAR